MDESMIDKILDELIQEAGPKAIAEMEKEDLANLEQHAFEFSPEHEEKMRQIIENGCIRTNAVEKDCALVPKRNRSRWGKKILLLAATFVLVLGIMVSSVGAWRESFVQYFLSVKEKYSDVREKEEDKFCLVDNIYFGYLPNGYIFEKKTELKNEIMYHFVNSQNDFFVFQVIENEWNQQINTEDSEVSEIIINGKDMVYSEREDAMIISWSENKHYYSAYSNSTKEEIVKFVENIKILNR